MRPQFVWSLIDIYISKPYFTMHLRRLPTTMPL